MVAGLLDAHHKIAHARELFGKLGQLVIVGGEQGLGATPGVNVLHHAPGQRETVVGGGAAADFVEHDEAAGGSGIQDDGRFGHLHHEGGAAARQVIGRADAGEDAVEDWQAGRVGGNEGAGLGQDGDQRGLPQVRALAAHVGAGDDGDEVGGIVEVEIVGDEASGFLFGEALDHGMASGEDAHLAGTREAWALVAVLSGHL